MKIKEFRVIFIFNTEMESPPAMKLKIKKNEVRAALTFYIEGHTGSDRLPPLRTISSDLGVSIYLIRKQLDAMQREGVIRNKNRVGTFLTSRQQRMPTIGVAFNPHDSNPYVDFPAIYAGVLTSLTENGYLIRNIGFKREKDLPKLVNTLGLAGVIFLGDGRENLPRFLEEMCFDHKIPFVYSGQNIYRDHNFDSLYNTVSLDYIRFARERAKTFIANGKKHILYYAVNEGGSFTSFKEELAQNGVELPEEYIVLPGEDQEERLGKAVARYPIDGILVDGGIPPYSQFFHFLHKNPSFRPFVSIEDNPLVAMQLKQYPEIQLDFQFESWQSFYFRMGECVGNMLTRSVEGELVRKAEKYSFKIIDPATIALENTKKEARV